MDVYNVKHPVGILIFEEQTQPYQQVISKSDPKPHPFSLKHLREQRNCVSGKQLGNKYQRPSNIFISFDRSYFLLRSIFSISRVQRMRNWNNYHTKYKQKNILPRKSLSSSFKYSWLPMKNFHFGAFQIVVTFNFKTSLSLTQNIWFSGDRQIPYGSTEGIKYLPSHFVNFKPYNR